LKLSLQLTQLQLGALSSTFFISGFISWIPGLIVDTRQMRFSMALGGFSGAIFTMLYWIPCCHRRDDDDPTNNDNWLFGTLMISYPVTILAILAVAISLSCGLIVGSVFKLTMICGGPHGKGLSVGIAKGFVGVGSGVYATIFQAYHNCDESALDFLPVIVIFFIVCADLPALVLLPSREEQLQLHLLKFKTTQLHLRLMYMTLFILCLFIVTSAIKDTLQEQEENGPAGIATTSTGREYGKMVVFWFVLQFSLLTELLCLTTTTTTTTTC
jgi:Nodulin-like